MECPYCHEVMILGEMVTPRDPIHWYPKTEENLFDFEKDKMKIVVSRWRFVRKSRKESWVCPACKKMFVDLESK